ncbi:MAG: flagellar biosynthetic protein FliR [Candidatus Marinarcus sp.]|uniref:flagellar biosynthetic protein FliR n=1 Tax=Candidatus Marinarcus sp. TaxID=3100987 RepID=UPI003B00DAD9
MEALLSLLDEGILFTFLLLLARIVAFIAFMPVFSHTAVSPTIRIALAFYLTIFIYPFIDIQNSVTQEMFVGALISEITLGLVASFLFNIVFSAVKIIGDLIGYATALSMSSMFDPSTGSNEGIISRFLYIIAILIFFETGLYEVTILMLAKSFSMVHLGAFDVFSYNGIELAIQEIKRMFAFAFSFAFPLFFIGFIMDVYYGYGTKSMPAFSPFVITFQLKFLLIFLFMMFGLEIFAENFTNYYISKFS